MSKGTVLLVEQDAVLANHLQEMLSKLGYTVPKPVASGLLAVGAAERFRPDLVIVDIETGGDGAGLEAAEIIHAKTDIPVLFLCGSSREALSGQAPGIPHPVCLVKPVSEPELAATLEMVLSRIDLERKLKESERKYQTLVENLPDITELKRTEEALRESEGRVRAGLSATPDSEGDHETLKLGDILDIPSIQPIMDMFVRYTGLGFAIVDLEGKLMIASGWQDVCRKFHRVHPETRKNCIECDTMLTRGIEPGAFKHYLCLNGMWDMATPLIIGGRHLGNLFTGQVFFDDAPPDYDRFRAQAAQYGFDEEEYLDAVRRVPLMKREDIEAALEFITRLAHMISKLSHGKLKLARTLAERDCLLDSLRRSEEKYRVLVENARELIVVAQDERIVFSNQISHEVAGYTSEELNGRPFSEFIHPDHREEVLNRYRARLKSDTDRNRYPVRILSKDGDVRWVDLNVVRIEWEGRPATLSFMTNITERKQAEDALLESESRLRAIFSAMTDVIFILDHEGRYLEIAPTKPNFLFKPAADLLGKTLHEVFPEKQAGIFLALVRKALDQRQTVSCEYQLTIDGNACWFSGTLSPIHENRVIFVARDITERKQAEDALRESEERYHEVFSNTSDGIYIIGVEPGPRFRYLDFNPAAERLIGVTSADLAGLYVEDVVGEDMAETVTLNNRRCLESATTLIFEEELSFRAGKMHFHTALIPVKDESGRISRIIGVSRDITEQKRAENALREEEEKYRLIVENQTDLIVKTDLEGRFLYASPSYCALFGKTEDELIGTTYFPLVHEDDLPVIEKAVATLSHPPHTCYYEERALTVQGWKWLGWAARAVTGSRGEIAEFIGSARDITERKQAEEALRESEERFRTLLESAPEAIFVQSKCRFVYVNPAAVKLFGASKAEDLLGKDFMERMAPEYREVVRSRIQFQLETGIAAPAMEEEYLRLDGTRAQVEVTAAPLKLRGENAHLVLIHDITERKRAEEALRESEEKYRILFEATPIGTGISDEEGNVLDMNRSMQDITGYTLEELKHLSAGKIYADPENRRRIVETLQTGQRVQDLEVEMARRDGGKYFVLLNMEMVNMGESSMLLSTIRDITERKQAEEALRESERKFAQLMEQAPISIEVYNPEGLLINANRAYEDLWRIPKETVVGKYNILQHQHAKIMNTLEPFEKVFRGERVEIPPFEHDPNSTGDFPTARKRYVQPYLYPIINEWGAVSHVVLMNVDITERKQLEQQLLQAQKMETIGRLAGGVAHDFNNILTVINANAELALMFMSPSDTQYEVFEEIRKSGERAANLTRQLLAFSRRQIIEPRVVSLNQILLDMDKMHRRLIGEHIELITIPDETLKPVKIDPGQIEQVFTNLVVNARDAMPEGGKLTIETRNVYLDEEYARSHPETLPGNYVMFAVSDTGIGMDRETLSHLFEPFFTTKPQGSGTGLGLPTCYGIVKQNNGGIWVYSEPGQGTTVKVYLPAVMDSPFNSGNLPGLSALPLGSETVLLVEDDTGIRNLVKRHLSASGYRVLSAANGDEALSVIYNHTGPIHLLITDVVMPLMGGKELADRMTERYPGLHILFMSGYTDNSIVQHGVLDPGIRFIQKPFSILDFMRKIREVLEG